MSHHQPSQVPPFPPLNSHTGYSPYLSLSGSREMPASRSAPSLRVCDCPLWLHQPPLRLSPRLLPLSRCFCASMVPQLRSRIPPPALSPSLCLYKLSVIQYQSLVASQSCALVTHTTAGLSVASLHFASVLQIGCPLFPAISLCFTRPVYYNGGSVPPKLSLQGTRSRYLSLVFLPSVLDIGSPTDFNID